ncbi:hypothetical protein J6590_007479 [Homalodisca vitripennis]|nr:hypothetical protein J6590_007479 [Homalodisca vitripennis]
MNGAAELAVSTSTPYNYRVLMSVAHISPSSTIRSTLANIFSRLSGGIDHILSFPYPPGIYKNIPVPVVFIVPLVHTTTEGCDGCPAVCLSASLYNVVVHFTRMYYPAPLTPPIGLLACYKFSSTFF